MGTGWIVVGGGPALLTRWVLLLALLISPIRGGLTREQRDAVLFSHNEARSTIAELTQSVDMLLMNWDNELEIAAQKYVKKCNNTHNVTVKIKNRIGIKGTIGQNTLVFKDKEADSMAKVNMSTTILNTWLTERDNYDHTLMKCKINQETKVAFTCDNYTQMIWDRTYLLGCAMADCEMGYFLQCLYSPQGNHKGRIPMRYGNTPCICHDPRYPVCYKSLCAERGTTNWPLAPVPGVKYKVRTRTTPPPKGHTASVQPGFLTVVAAFTVVFAALRHDFGDAASLT